MTFLVLLYSIFILFILNLFQIQYKFNFISILPSSANTQALAGLSWFNLYLQPTIHPTRPPDHPEQYFTSEIELHFQDKSCQTMQIGFKKVFNLIPTLKIAQQGPKRAKNAQNGAKLQAKRQQYTSKAKVDSLYKKAIRQF